MQKFNFLIILLSLLGGKPRQEALQAEVINIKIVTSKLQVFVLLRKYETFQNAPYKLGDYWYIGYGHLTSDSISDITKKQASLLLENDFAKNLKHFNNIKDHRRRYLLAMLSFNIGIGKVLRSSLYNDNLNDKDFISTYLNYSNFNGIFHKRLYQRRENELKLFYASKLVE